MLPSAGLCIGTLRARVAEGVVPEQRFLLERALSADEITPRGFLARAILIVRKVSESAPVVRGRLDEWSTGVGSRINSIWRTAARPYRGRVDPGASAVLFEDEAELRACLLTDIAAGVALQRWWWAGFRDRWRMGGGHPAIVCAVLEDNVALVPAVFGMLHQWGQLGEIVAAIEVMQARRLLDRIATTFRLWRVSAAVRLQSSPGEGWGGTVTEFPVPSRAKGGAPAGRMEEPWSGDSSLSLWEADVEDAWRVELGRICGGAPAELAPEGRLLMALGVVLSREPWRAQTRDFQVFLLKWSLRDASAAGGGGGRRRIEAEGAVGVGAVGEREIADEAQREHERSDGARASEEVRRAQVTRKERGTAESRRPTATSQFPSSDAEKGRRGRVLPETVRQTHPDEERVTTNWGGVFYLLNLMEVLELPECFEEEWRLGSDVGPWGVLETLGRHWTMDECDEGDPLWPLLGRLAGRLPGVPPGDRYQGSETYRQPSAWREGLGHRSEALYWSDARNMLRVWGGEEGVIAELPRTTAAAVDQARDVSIEAGFDLSVPLRRAPAARAPLANGYKLGGSRNFNRLFGAVIPFVQRRLGLALDDESGDGATIRSLLRLRSRIHVSASHLDVVASVEDIALAARRAGLDRNPGWLPHLGRVVLFHFE